MTGLLYKEYKQNRFCFLLTVIVAALAVSLPIALYAIGGEKSPKAILELLVNDDMIVRILFILVGFLSADALQGVALMGDDTKKWGLFIASSPKGIKGFLYTKYILVFTMCGLMLVSCIFFDYLFCTIAYQVMGQDVLPISDILIFVFYIQIFLRGIEMPFFVRFGIKTGNMIKLIILIGGMSMFFVLVLINPGGIIENLVDSIYKIVVGEATDTITLIISIIPFLALGTYYLSYKISCKVYMKGVEQYDK